MASARSVQIVAEVDINRSPEEVFDYCSDLSHEPEWNPMMRQSTKLTEGPIGQGTRFSTAFVKAPAMVMEYTHYARPTTWSIAGRSSALQANGSGEVQPSAGGTHLVMRMELVPKGPLKLASSLIKRRVQPKFEEDVRHIKTRLEGV